jgi:hypothetical protein
MHPLVRAKLTDGPLVELIPGDIIGRSERAALCLSEPHISEAHAMVSLRGGELKLLALRGRISIAGKPTAQITLSPGQRVLLGSKTPLFIEEVCLPTEVLTLVGREGMAQVIASVCSLRVGAHPLLSPGFLPESDAIFWTLGSRLFVRVGEEPSRELGIGEKLVVAGETFEVEARPLERATHVPTQGGSDHGAPLHLILNFDTVHLIAGPQRVTLDGNAARIICELAAIGAPVAWQEVARSLWGGEVLNESVLRERWDSSLARLRRKLTSGRVRSDLVHSTRVGLVELLLMPGDTLEDRM